MGPSASFPDMAIALEAPLEVPSLGEGRRRWFCTHPRCIWFVLVSILTLVITLTVLYYVGALSANRTPSSPRQYKHSRDAAAPGSENRNESGNQTDLKAALPANNDSIAIPNEAEAEDVACILEVNSPLDQPNTPRSQPNSPPGRLYKVPAAVLHFRLDLGLFNEVNFSELRVDSSFCVVTGRSFAPDFQELIPKIDVEFDDGKMLTIYTKRDGFVRHLNARRFYYSLKGDEPADFIASDIWQLLHLYGVDLLRKLVLVNAGGSLSPQIDAAFGDHFERLNIKIRRIQLWDVEPDLQEASTEDEDVFSLPKRPIFLNLDMLITKQTELIESINKGWREFIERLAIVFDVAHAEDWDTFESTVLDFWNDIAIRNPERFCEILPQLRVVEVEAQSSIQQLSENLDEADRMVWSFALKIGAKRRSDVIMMNKASELSTGELTATSSLNGLYSISIDEQERWQGLKMLKAKLETCQFYNNEVQTEKLHFA